MEELKNKLLECARTRERKGCSKITRDLCWVCATFCQIHERFLPNSRANPTTITRKFGNNHEQIQKKSRVISESNILRSSEVFVRYVWSVCSSAANYLLFRNHETNQKSPHLNDHLPQAKRCFAACLPPLWYEHRSSLLRGQENKQQLLLLCGQ